MQSWSAYTKLAVNVTVARHIQGFLGGITWPECPWNTTAPVLVLYLVPKSYIVNFYFSSRLQYLQVLCHSRIDDTWLSAWWFSRKSRVFSMSGLWKDDYCFCSVLFANQLNQIPSSKRTPYNIRAGKNTYYECEIFALSVALTYVYNDLLTCVLFLSFFVCNLSELFSSGNEKIKEVLI